MTNIIAILGMHRSGTSCLAGCLQARGLELGAAKKGNRENPDVFRLHERVLKANGGSWFNPPSKVIWNKENIVDLRKLIDGYTAEIWGFKDPRSVFVLDGWVKNIPKTRLRMVATFRHPLCVALSLNRRNKFPIEQGMDLWRRYNERLLEVMKEFDVLLIDFDVCQKTYFSKLNRICERLGLSVSPITSEFYNSDLISCKPSPSGITDRFSKKVDCLYEQLKDQAL